jgi:hypothetical protein
MYANLRLAFNVFWRLRAQLAPFDLEPEGKVVREF